MKSKNVVYISIWKKTHKLLKDLSEERMDAMTKIVHLAALREYKEHIKNKKS